MKIKLPKWMRHKQNGDENQGEIQTDSMNQFRQNILKETCHTLPNEFIRYRATGSFSDLNEIA